MKSGNRSKTIIKTSILGIAANFLLALLKAIVGVFANAVSVIMDAVNNLSDAISSLVTLIGAKISSKPADKKHPMGYGRAEFITSMVIASIILAAGVTSFYESIKKIISPDELSHSNLSLALIGVAVLVKIALGLFTRAMGKKTKSDSLLSSGLDALFDSLVSALTLLSAAIYLIWDINLDGYFGAAVSLFIIKSGIGLLIESLNTILGKRFDPALSKAIKEEAGRIENVLSAHDLFLDSYGPDRTIGFIHLAVPDTISAQQIDEISRKVTYEVYKKFGVYLTCGIYAVPLEDSPWHQMYSTIKGEISKYPGVIEMHGFHVSEQSKTVYFDVVRDFSISDVASWHAGIVEIAKGLYPDYNYVVVADIDYSD